MTHTRFWSITLILIVSLLGAACGSDPTATPAPPTSTPPPTATPAPSEAPAAAPGEFPTVDPDALSRLDSYQFNFALRIETEAGDSGEMRIEQAATEAPEMARRLLLQVTGQDVVGLGGMGAEDWQDAVIEMVQIEDTVWVRYDQEGWEQAPAGGQDILDVMGESLNLADLTGGIEEDAEGGFAYIGQETINGLATQHYRATKDSLDNLSGLGDQEMTVEEATADIWFAGAPDLPVFIVRMSVELNGELAEGERGSIALELNVQDVNQPIVITAPAGISSGGATSDAEIFEGDGFTLTYPADWQVINLNDQAACMNPGIECPLALAHPSRDGTNLNLMYFDLGEEMDAATISQQAWDAFAAGTPGADLESTQEIKVGGHPAVQRVFSAPSFNADDGQAHFIQVYVVDGTTAYQFTVWAPTAEARQEHEADMLAVIDSLTFTP